MHPIIAACPDTGPKTHPRNRAGWLALAGLLAALCLPVAAHATEVGKVVQVVGSATLAGQPVQVGAPVREGQPIATGANGYLYIQTADQGFLIVRPNSRLSVPVYQVNTAQPAQSRFKFELEQGVVRSLSGQAVPAARQNFRFNTPVAAIGVVGTDFTVFTNDQTTRVAVNSGGVVVSGFGEGCLAEGTGPCETPARQLLLAQQVGQILQVSRGSVAPQVLRNGSLAPDATAPPRTDEPPTQGSAPGPVSLAPIKMNALDDVQRAAQAATSPAVVWGRWQPAANQPANLNLAEAMRNGQLFGLNPYFAVLRNSSTPWVLPQQAAASFALQGHLAQISNGGSLQIATIENATLQVDFAQRQFSTRFDLVQPGGERWARNAAGAVGADGSFGNPSQFANNTMVVQGVVGQPQGLPALQAGYVFQTRIDDARSASGVTFWGAR